MTAFCFTRARCARRERCWHGPAKSNITLRASDSRRSLDTEAPLTQKNPGIEVNPTAGRPSAKKLRNASSATTLASSAMWRSPSPMCCIASRGWAWSCTPRAPPTGSSSRGFTGGRASTVLERFAIACRYADSTQRSFPSPPWLELTTSEPGVRATRQKAPGTSRVSRPRSMNGRRSTWRGAALIRDGLPVDATIPRKADLNP